MPLSDQEVSSIEFENDGVTDSLTGVMAPSLFHENLKREIADPEGRKTVALGEVF